MSTQKNSSEFNPQEYTDFCVEFGVALDKIREDYSLGETAATDRILSFFIADKFINITPDKDNFVCSDGANDKGIDFWFYDDDGSGGFIIGQCKSTDLISSGSKSPVSFSKDSIRDLTSGIDYLLDGGESSNKDVAELRSKYLSERELLDEEESLPIEADMVVLGKLTEDAQAELEKARNIYKERGVDIKLYTWKEMYDKLHEGEDSVDRHNITLKLKVGDPEKEKDMLMLRQNNWISAVVCIDGLIDGFDNYRNGLFDLNVRAQFQNRSSINKQIVETLGSDKGRKQFLHLNNGVLILADSYKVKEQNRTIEVRGAQIINGCQSVTSMHEAYQSALLKGDNEAADKVKQTKVIVKIINNDAVADPDAINSIILATNNQNPMSPRNLKSNSSEQKKIKSELSNDMLGELKYFYVRKDNELEVATDKRSKSDVPSFVKSDFKIEATTARGKNKYRSIDNRDLAQTWLAWLGDAQDANQQSGDALFKEEQKKVYELIFTKRPSDDYWNSIKNPDHEFSKTDAGFIDGIPHAFQYLLAMAVKNYVQSRLSKIKESRSAAIQRLKESSKLPISSDATEEANALRKDKTYYINHWKSIMPLSYVELSSFVLAKAFETLDVDTCKTLCKLSDVREWLKCGMTDKGLQNSDDFFNNKDSFLYCLYGFIDYTIGMYLNTNYSRIVGETRQKALLGKRSEISEIKYLLNEQNQALKDFPKPFKKLEDMTPFQYLKMIAS